MVDGGLSTRQCIDPEMEPVAGNGIDLGHNFDGASRRGYTTQPQCRVVEIKPRTVGTPTHAAPHRVRSHGPRDTALDRNNADVVIGQRLAGKEWED